jgi:glycosyltransferase involved in cell wall biosynthesis
MRIAFGDFCQWDFHVASVDVAPLGGSQSAACYLARALARLGHEVFFITALSSPGRYDGVECLSWQQANAQKLRELGLDAFVCIMAAGYGGQLRQMLGPNCRLILWNQHAADQPGVKSLRNPDERQTYSGLAMVSQWQLRAYQQAFGIDPARMTILRNAIAPAFAGQFAVDEPILPHKAQPPLLAYTSTPFRGLELLVDFFPRIRDAVPGARLQVFSSMRVYGASAQTDEESFGALYARCRQTPGVEYVGSLPQGELARALKSVSALAYPNTFAETSCIAVMEAMASGCRVITSALGALPETTAGFARLIGMPRSKEDYQRQFVEQTVNVLREMIEEPAQAEALLRNQLAYVGRELTWPARAEQWVGWLESLKP